MRAILARNSWPVARLLGIWLTALRWRACIPRGGVRVIMDMVGRCMGVRGAPRRWPEGCKEIFAMQGDRLMTARKMRGGLAMGGSAG
jgi:hypothetical protein